MSPIEKKLLKALIGGVPSDWKLFDFSRLRNSRWVKPDVVSDDDSDPDTEDDEHGNGDALVFVWHDVAVGSYRADFLLSGNGSGVQLVVECDGHDWHDRTKQQAAYDRSRDRELLLLGFTTIRFTGSEIHHSAARCAAEVFAVLRHISEIDNLPIDAWSHGYRQGLKHQQETTTDEFAEEHW